MERLKGRSYCSMGVVDTSGLNEKRNAIQTSFSLAEMRARYPDWSPVTPRPEVEYRKSPHIRLPRSASIIADFSASFRENNTTKTLIDVIHDYVLDMDSTRHMFCIHSRSTPEFYYDRMLLSIPDRLNEIRKAAFPRVIIIADTPPHSAKVYEALEKQKLYVNARLVICNLDSQPSIENLQSARILIGSSRKVMEYFQKASNGRKMVNLFHHLKFIVVNNAEKMLFDHTFADFLSNISPSLEQYWTRFMFMFRFPAQSGSVSKTIHFCRKHLKGNMFIEVDRPRINNFFDRVEFLLITSASEVAHKQSALAINKGTTLSQHLYNMTAKVMTPRAQKLLELPVLIQKLREERNEKNQRKSQSRRERILIITRGIETANQVTMFLKIRVGDFYRELHIGKITLSDSVEEVEVRNCEFRSGNLDVLVIDWRSLKAVSRGTVDSVIFFDSPDPNYFQTIMETELENLTSLNAVKLNLYIMIEQEADIKMVYNYIQFLVKYGKCAPQWFAALYERYKTDYERRKKELSEKQCRLSLPPCTVLAM